MTISERTVRYNVLSLLNIFCEHVFKYFILILPFLATGQSSFNVELLDNWHDQDIIVNSTTVRYNDCWGFVQNGQEYAIIGSTEGMHFLKITDENRLQEVDFIAGLHQSTMVVHRDVKVYQNYAYTVCDEGNSSLQIIDLSYLPDSVVKVNDLGIDFHQAHNIFIDSSSALMYSCDPKSNTGGVISENNFQVWSLTDPVNPQLVWEPDPSSFPIVHDCYVRENIAYLNCGTDGLRVYNFTDPVNPVFLQNLFAYQDQGFNHQGWMSPNGKLFFFADETNGKKIKKCSVNNHQLTIEKTFGTNYEDGSVAHNIMCSDDFAYVAYYNEGFRVYDIRGAGAVEVAHYDTYPDNSAFKMQGAWGIYSELPSGRILVSDRTYGLFLFDFREDIFSITSGDNAQLYPNPIISGGTITLKFNRPNYAELRIVVYDASGRKVLEDVSYDTSYIETDVNIRPGTYSMKIYYTNYLDDKLTETVPFIVY